MNHYFNDLLVPDPSISYYCGSCTHSTGWSHLMKLVMMVDEYPEAMDMIHSLLKNDDEINKQNDEGWTALMLACRNGKDNMVKILLDAGADTNLKSRLGVTALIIASLNGNKDNIKLLVDAGSNVNHQDINSETAMMKCFWRSDTTNKIDIMKILIDAGYNLDIENCNGDTILFMACKYCLHTEIIKFLINAGSNINYQNRNGNTALIVLCSYFNLKIRPIKILIDYGADINCKNKLGETALMIAENDKIVELLIESGAKVDEKDIHNCTALMKLFMDGIIGSQTAIKLIHLSRKTLLDQDSSHKSAYDYYISGENDFLDDYHLRLLKGEIAYNRTKSAKY